MVRLKYFNEKEIAGISLYRHEHNFNCNLPHKTINEGFDTYFINAPSSLGQIWTKEQLEELKKLEEHNFAQKRLQQVKDMFIFCCYTGLAYNEMTTLTTNNIEIGFDGKEWIQMIRKKTNRPEIARIPLFFGK